jgi:hypothetical protein
VLRRLLYESDRLLAHVLSHQPLGRTFWQLVVLTVAGAAAYGAVLGGWHGGRLAFYDTVKLPLVLVLTAAVTMIFNWIVALALNVPLRTSQVAVLTLLGLTTASVGLASLAPVAWFFTLCAPPQAPRCPTCPSASCCCGC